MRNSSNQEIIDNQQVADRINKEINEFNKRFGNWEQIKKIALLPAELSIEGGELTPTLKLKRKIINEKYKVLIEKMYS